MDLIQIIIKKDNNYIKYIKLLRDFDGSLSMDTIKKQMDNNGYVVEFDLESYDLLDEINEIEKKDVFRQLIEKLVHLGATITIFENDVPISIEILDNLLESMNETKRQIERHNDLEHGW